MFEFLASGQYNVILGKSFDAKPKKKTPKYFHIKNKDSLDARQVVYANEAKLEKKKDRYNVHMKQSGNSNLVYEAELNAEEEYNCILIYNEENKTITIERQSAQISLVGRKPGPHQNGHRLTQSPLPGNNSNQYTSLQTPPIVREPIRVDSNTTNGTIATPMSAAVPADDFDFDLSKDMDEILDSDGEEGLSGSEEEEGSDTFEEIATAPIPLQQQQRTSPPLSLPVTPSLPPSSPNIPVNLALPTTPNTAAASPVATPSGKKRKFKMASVPIRHPGMISPLAAAVTPPATTTLTPPAVVLTPMANKRLKSQQNDTSSSGSEEEDDESSSGSESGSTETGSSSGSEEDSGSESDDIFKSLEQDISISLSKSGPSAPASPQQHFSPYMTTTPGHTPTPSSNHHKSSQQQQQQNGVGGGPGPMSLRALFNENDEEEEGSSSSESEDSD